MSKEDSEGGFMIPRTRRGCALPRGWRHGSLLSSSAASCLTCSASPSLSQIPSVKAFRTTAFNQSINLVAMKLALFLAVLITAVAADRVADELVKNGLPMGLLPSSVASYTIDKGGHFTLDLKAPCYARIDDQLVYYSPNITGRLKYGSISSLDGIQTKQLFVWLPVTGIYVDVPATPYIYFEVGVLTKRLAVAVFDSPIKCSSKVETGLRIPIWM